MKVSKTVHDSGVIETSTSVEVHEHQVDVTRLEGVTGASAPHWSAFIRNPEGLTVAGWSCEGRDELEGAALLIGSAPRRFERLGIQTKVAEAIAPIFRGNI